MRETGVVRFQYSGDKATVDAYVGEARTQLGKLKQRMKVFGMQQLLHSRTYADGVVVTVASVYGQDTIQIDAPVRRAAQVVPGVQTTPLEEAAEVPVYSIVVGADENWIVDIAGAPAGGNGAWQFDRNTLDQPVAYAGGANRTTARGGRYATLTALSFVPDGNSEHVVSSVRDTALYEACVPTIRKTTAPPAGLLGADLSLYYRQIFDDAHWPVLHKQLINFMGLAKLPSELHGQLNQYLPVRLYPLHYYLDTEGDVVVVFGMQQVLGVTTPVVSGNYATDRQVYDIHEYVDGVENIVGVQSPLNTVLARCKAKNLPLDMRAPQSTFGAATLPTSLGKDVEVENAPEGSSVAATVFGDVLQLPIPMGLDLDVQDTFTTTISGYLVTYVLIGSVDTNAQAFTGTVRLRAATPTGVFYQAAGGVPVSLHSVVDTGSVSPAEPPSTKSYYATYPVKLPLDFLEFVDVKSLINAKAWFTPPVAVPKNVPVLSGAGRTIRMYGINEIGPGYHDAHQTFEDHLLNGRASPLAPFKMTYAVTHFDYLARLPVPQYLTDVSLVSFVDQTFNFTPAGVLQVLTSAASVVYATYSTTYNVTTGVINPLLYVGHHKGADVPLATYSGNYAPTSFRVEYAAAVEGLTGIAVVETNRQVAGIPVVYPDAHVGVLFPLNYSSLSGTMNYSFFYKGVRIAGPDTITYGALPSASPAEVLYSQSGSSVGTDGVGTIEAEDNWHVSSPHAEYPQFLVNSQAGSPVSLITPEYPLAGAGTRTGGLVVTCYLRNAKGTDAGVCIIQRSFAADVFASAYLANPFDSTTLPELRSLISWFLDTASQPSAPATEEDPAARVSFPAMIAAAEAAAAYYDTHSADGTLDAGVFKNLIRDIGRNGRTVLVNNFASPALIDFITSHSQTLVLLPYSPALPASA